MTETRQSVIHILEQICKGKAIDENTALYDELAIDSLTIFNELLPCLEKEFHIQITPLDLMPENFETVGALTHLVEMIKERNHE